MNEINIQGGSAFPCHGSMGEVVSVGMTLRDYFAAKALQGCLSQSDQDGSNDWDNPQLAQYAYMCADAMLKEREL